MMKMCPKFSSPPPRIRKTPVYTEKQRIGRIVAKNPSGKKRGR
jgi:hypothetical protein